MEGGAAERGGEREGGCGLTLSLMLALNLPSCLEGVVAVLITVWAAALVNPPPLAAAVAESPLGVHSGEEEGRSSIAGIPAAAAPVEGSSCREGGDTDEGA